MASKGPTVAERDYTLRTIEHDNDTLAIIRQYAGNSSYSYRQIAFMLKAEHDIDIAPTTIRRHVLLAMDSAMTRLDDMRDSLASTLVSDLVDNWNTLQEQANALDLVTATQIINDSMGLADGDTLTPTEAARLRGAHSVVKTYQSIMFSVDRHALRINQLTGLSHLLQDTEQAQTIVMELRNKPAIAPPPEDNDDRP